MDIGKVINQAKDLILNPKQTIKKLKDKKITKESLVFYLAVIGIPILIGRIIGDVWFYGGRYAGWAIGLAIGHYILAIIGVLVFGYVMNMIAENFKTKPNLEQAMKLVSYAATPWFLIGILYAIPQLGIITFLGGLYGLYILYIGIPILMETPKNQQMSYFIVGLIMYIIIIIVIFWIMAAIWGSIYVTQYYPYWW